ncbi:MAG: GNAT family N-acetyltransferase [Pseudomonadota bacterium]
MHDLTLSPMTIDHLPAALELSRAEQWPHRLEDWEMLLSLSAGYVAISGNSVVGTALIADFGAQMSTLNMIIVSKSERGKGLGKKLMKAVMAGTEGRELRLIATPDGLPLYQKLGFVAEAEIDQCQGIMSAIPSVSHAATHATAQDMPDIAGLDAQVTAADRKRLLSWLADNSEQAVIRGADGAISGYASCRRFGRGWVIGPVLARDIEQAKDLICFLGASKTGAFMRIDTETALGLTPWLGSLGLLRVASGTKMRKNACSAPHATFGLFSQALG